MAHWSIHDLRKTARTNFSTLIEPHVAEIMLGHRLPGTWQVYDHYNYLPEQAKALVAWHERLEKLVGQTVADSQDGNAGASPLGLLRR